MKSDTQTIIFTREDLIHFSHASKDYNFAHNPDYPLMEGGVIVHGILGVLACLAFIQIKSDWILKWICADFIIPMKINQSYHLHIESCEENGCSIKILAKNECVAKIDCTFEKISNAPYVKPLLKIDEHCEPDKGDPQTYFPFQLNPGMSVQGIYEPNWHYLSILNEKFSFFSSSVRAEHILMLMLSGYSIGMKIPGAYALYLSFNIAFHNFDEPIEHLKCLNYSLYLENYAAFNNLAELSLSGKGENHFSAQGTLSALNQIMDYAFHKISFCVASSFTIDPVILPLKEMGKYINLDADVKIASYNQILQVLLNKNSLFHYEFIHTLVSTTLFRKDIYGNHEMVETAIVDGYSKPLAIISGEIRKAQRRFLKAEHKDDLNILKMVPFSLWGLCVSIVKFYHRTFGTKIKPSELSLFCPAHVTEVVETDLGKKPVYPYHSGMFSPLTHFTDSVWTIVFMPPKQETLVKNGQVIEKNILTLIIVFMTAS
ncbi:MAG: hypothetical protein GY710_07920 [Desulfobacteraceae bacterium]|nr:hypothetical protein [Desulfobacteraceae bacterium]